MKNLIRGTVAAMIVSVGILGSTMTVYAAPVDEVSLHTTQMTFEIEEGKEGHEITEAERAQLREKLAKGAEEDLHEKSMEKAKKEADNVINFFENIINFFS